MKYSNRLEQYAELVVTIGINIQNGQGLVINSPIETAEFARALSEVAYKKGAKDVIIHWNDEKFSKIRFTYSPIDIFENLPDWFGESRNFYANKNYSLISISASDPELFKGLDAKKLSANNIALKKAIKPMHDRINAGFIAWSVVSVPTISWAKKVFPKLSEEDAVNSLWDCILKAVRVDEPNPIKAWNQHKENLLKYCKFLNEQQFVSFHYKNSLGTDLTVGMPENYIFEGGGDITNDGIYFFPNMPTEEVFSMPHYKRVNGVVFSSLPLNYQGTLVEEFSLSFKDGRIVSYTAKKGYEALQRLIETDEGSHYLGEIALVPNKSPISDLGILFYNTLYDENASCHFAIGSSYPSCIKGGRTASREEVKSMGGNDSLEHVDFMVGTADLEITATTKDGHIKQIFNNGNWAF